MGLKSGFKNPAFQRGRGLAMVLLCGFVAWERSIGECRTNCARRDGGGQGASGLGRNCGDGTSSRGIRKLDASFAVTTKSLQEIQNLGPLSTADIFRMAPGVWVESSGGETGANASVRGFRLTVMRRSCSCRWTGFRSIRITTWHFSSIRRSCDWTKPSSGWKRYAGARPRSIPACRAPPSTSSPRRVPRRGRHRQADRQRLRSAPHRCALQWTAERRLAG